MTTLSKTLIAAAAFGEVQHQDDSGDKSDDRGKQVGGGCEPQRDGEQGDAWLPLVPRTLHRVSHSHGRVHQLLRRAGELSDPVHDHRPFFVRHIGQITKRHRF